MTAEFQKPKMKAPKLEIPSLSPTDWTPHGCLWEARLVSYEARRAGDGGKLIWELYGFKCGICATEFRGSRMYEPEVIARLESHLDPHWLLDTGTLIIGQDRKRNLFVEHWPLTATAILSSPDYLQLRRDVYRAIDIPSYPQGEHDDDEFRKCKRCGQVFGYRENQCVGPRGF